MAGVEGDLAMVKRRRCFTAQGLSFDHGRREPFREPARHDADHSVRRERHLQSVCLGGPVGSLKRGIGLVTFEAG